MPLITLETVIAAPPERCFDLMRSVEAHTQSTSSPSTMCIPSGRWKGAP